MTGFELDHKGLQRIAQSAQMSRAMQRAAQRGADWAAQQAPKDTGEYARSFRAEPIVVTVAGKPRAGARLLNDASRIQGGQSYPYSWAVEWGLRAQHILARAVDVIEKG